MSISIDCVAWSDKDFWDLLSAEAYCACVTGSRGRIVKRFEAAASHHDHDEKELLDGMRLSPAYF